MSEYTIQKTERYGWRRDLPDYRDKQFVTSMALAALPSSVDLRPSFTVAYDQGQLGSCTANAIGAMIEYTLGKQKFSVFMPSRLFIYYNERMLEGTIGQDSGAMLRTGMKVINKFGACSEVTSPYVISRFKRKPSQKAYTEGLKHIAIEYMRVDQTKLALQSCLAEGLPVVFGFAVYRSFESAEVARTGVVPMPNPGESMLGGHAVVLVGYDDRLERYLVRNSWGTAWGQQGYFWMPYEYVHNPNLAADFWTLHTMSG